MGEVETIVNDSSNSNEVHSELNMEQQPIHDDDSKTADTCCNDTTTITTIDKENDNDPNNNSTTTTSTSSTSSTSSLTPDAESSVESPDDSPDETTLSSSLAPFNFDFSLDNDTTTTNNNTTNNNTTNIDNYNEQELRKLAESLAPKIASLLLSQEEKLETILSSVQATQSFDSNDNDSNQSTSNNQIITTTCKNGKIKKFIAVSMSRDENDSDEEDYEEDGMQAELLRLSRAEESLREELEMQSHHFEYLLRNNHYNEDGDEESNDGLEVTGNDGDDEDANEGHVSSPSVESKDTPTKDPEESQQQQQQRQEQSTSQISLPTKSTKSSSNSSSSNRPSEPPDIDTHPYAIGSFIEVIYEGPSKNNKKGNNNNHMMDEFQILLAIIIGRSKSKRSFSLWGGGASSSSSKRWKYHVYYCQLGTQEWIHNVSSKIVSPPSVGNVKALKLSLQMMNTTSTGKEGRDDEQSKGIVSSSSSATIGVTAAAISTSATTTSDAATECRIGHDGKEESFKEQKVIHEF